MSLRTALAIAVTALLARVFNLGSFSLWLDEILGRTLSQGSLHQVWTASAADLVHPPLANILGWGMTALGIGDTAQRLLPIACGVLTVLLLAGWASRHFGQRAGLFTGVLGALSPFGVRYSQELRPYSYLLLFIVLTLVALDRLVNRTDAPRIVTLLLVLLGGLYSHYLFALVAAPAAVLIIAKVTGRERLKDPGRWRLLAGAALATGLAILGFVPWLRTLMHPVARLRSGGVEPIGLDVLAHRWQFLTVGAREGDPLTWGGIILLAVVLIGLISGARSLYGRVVIAGAAAGLFGAELMLRIAGHWSNGRYDIVGWPFAVVLAALGLDWLAAFLPHKVATTAVLVLLCTGGVVRLAAYDHSGRQHWDKVAAAVRCLHRAGETVFVENEWTRISLAYYLFGPTLKPGAGNDISLVTAGENAGLIASSWPPGSCALFVAAGVPISPAARAALAHFPVLARFPYTDEARIFLLTPAGRHDLFRQGVRLIGDAAPGVVSCGEEVRLLPLPLRFPEGGRLDALAFGWRQLRRRFGYKAPRFEFDRMSTETALAFGWSGWERTPQGEDFVWAEGRTAVLSLASGGQPWRHIRMRVWPIVDPKASQTITASLNGFALARVELHAGPQIVDLETSSATWVKGENILRFDFGYALPPHELDPKNGDLRQLAVAFDWLELGR